MLFQGYTALHIAAQQHKEAIMQYLIQDYCEYSKNNELSKILRFFFCFQQCGTYNWLRCLSGRILWQTKAQQKGPKSTKLEAAYWL